MNILGGNELASHLVIDAERLTDWHDFQTEVINVTRARVAAAGLYALAGKNTSSLGIQPLDIDAASKGTGKGRGSESRICHDSGKLGNLMKTVDRAIPQTVQSSGQHFEVCHACGARVRASDHNQTYHAPARHTFTHTLLTNHTYPNDKLFLL